MAIDLYIVVFLLILIKKTGLIGFIVFKTALFRLYETISDQFLRHCVSSGGIQPLALSANKQKEELKKSDSPE